MVDYCYGPIPPSPSLTVLFVSPDAVGSKLPPLRPSLQAAARHGAPYVENGAWY